MEATSSTIVILRNEDVNIERPYRLTIPPSVDTLAELCSCVTEAVPPTTDATGRGYRFLYSVAGKPLWRVRECLEAGIIVVSVGPGFTARKAALPSTAAHAHAVDVTPNKQMLTGAADSLSPPAQRPDGAITPNGMSPVPVWPSTSEGYRGVTVDSDTAIRGVSITSPAARAAQLWGKDTYTADVHHQHQLTNDDANYYNSSDARWRGSEENDDAPSSTQLFKTPGGAAPPPPPPPPPPPFSRHSVGESPKPPLHPTHDKAVPPPPPPPPATESSSRPSYDPHMYPKRSTTNSPSSAAHLHRGSVKIDGKLHHLLPAPTFLTNAFAEEILEGDSSFQTGLRMYASRKWGAFDTMQRIDPTELLGTAEVQHTLQESLARCGAPAVPLHSPCRVVVSGPPCSGVSTTAALLLREAIPQFSSSGAFKNHFLLVLDFDMLFGGAPLSEDVDKKRRRIRKGSNSTMRDVFFLFQIMIRATLDAIAIQRPSLRMSANLLAQLWDKVISAVKAPPDFRTYPQVASLVGHKVLSDWNAVATQAFPILQAAASRPDDMELRDAALDTIFYAIPLSIAASLRFTGAVMALDNMGVLSTAGGRRVDRAAGDLSAVLKAYWADNHVHCIAAWPSATPLTSTYLPIPTDYVNTVGFLSTNKKTKHRSHCTDFQFPEYVLCQGRQYPLAIFLDCPGYLAVLAALVRPLRPKVKAFYASAHALHAQREADSEEYYVRADDPAVGAVLLQLQQLVRR